MRKLTSLILSMLFVSAIIHAQDSPTKTQKGHTNQNKFRQLKDVLATPNNQHTASGAPGVKYTQQKVDYVMNIILNEYFSRIYAHAITIRF